ncbi:hypothetical protein GF402_07210 [Candidatus Fermentibacteria bacterium]|nr:hypothetical protein [Candidatus Fermentibacteria bacterium]
MRSQKVSKNLYGFVKGRSMWPALLPGDVLKAEYVATKEIRQGDIIVRITSKGSPVVHRFVRIINLLDGRRFMQTSGDRSGLDKPSAIQSKTLKVFAVLRRRKWRRPMNRHFPLAMLVPTKLMNIHLKLARRFLQ